MRGSLLKCSGEQVRKATDSEYLGTELPKVLSQELLKSRERSGQRGFVDVEVEGRPEEEPPEETRPNVSDVIGGTIHTRRGHQFWTSWEDAGYTGKPTKYTGTDVNRHRSADRHRTTRNRL